MADAKTKKGREVRIGAVLAGALLVVLLGWLILHDGGSDDDGGDTTVGSGEPAIVSADELGEIAAEGGMPVYWAGEQEDTQLEVSGSKSGERVFVRYLSEDAEAGDSRADFLTVGSYAFEDAAAALRRQAKTPGGVLAAAPGDGTVYYNEERPESVYVAYPDVDVEIEVYDPDPARALALVTGGKIVPVEEP